MSSSSVIYSNVASNFRSSITKPVVSCAPSCLVSSSPFQTRLTPLILRRLHTNLTVSLRHFTDKNSLFDFISNGSKTSEQRIMLEIGAALEAFKNHDIFYVGFIRSGFNMPACLTRSMHQSKDRKSLTGALLIKPAQWIARTHHNQYVNSPLKRALKQPCDISLSLETSFPTLSLQQVAK